MLKLRTKRTQLPIVGECDNGEHNLLGFEFVMDATVGGVQTTVQIRLRRYVEINARRYCGHYRYEINCQSEQPQRLDFIVEQVHLLRRLNVEE